MYRTDPRPTPALDNGLIRISHRYTLATGMEPLEQQTSPTRPAKRFIVICLVAFAFVAVAVALVFDPFEPASPLAIYLTHSIPRSSPSGWPRDVLVPSLDMTNLCGRGVLVEMRLECQSNGTWIGWPAHVEDGADLLANVRRANWQVGLDGHADDSTFPNDTPANTTSNLLRVHGFIAKEMAGLSKLSQRVQFYFHYRNSKDPIMRKLPWSKNFRTYPAPTTEFVTAPFYLTNQMTPLTVEIR